MASARAASPPTHQHPPTPARTRVDARVADVGVGEGHKLALVRGIGHDFLVAAHRGVEHDLADLRAALAKADALEHAAVLEHQLGVLLFERVGGGSAHDQARARARRGGAGARRWASPSARRRARRSRAAPSRRGNRARRGGAQRALKGRRTRVARRRRAGTLRAGQRSRLHSEEGFVCVCPLRLQGGGMFGRKRKLSNVSVGGSGVRVARDFKATNTTRTCKGRFLGECVSLAWRPSPCATQRPHWAFSTFSTSPIDCARRVLFGGRHTLAPRRRAAALPDSECDRTQAPRCPHTKSMHSRSVFTFINHHNQLLRASASGARALPPVND